MLLDLTARCQAHIAPSPRIPSAFGFQSFLLLSGGLLELLCQKRYILYSISNDIVSTSCFLVVWIETVSACCQHLASE